MSTAPTSAVPTAISAPVQIELQLGTQVQRFSYEQAFVVACSLLDHGQIEEAATVFWRLREFADRGPRAFIMQAFCEAAALHFEDCSKPLAQVLDGDKRQLAADLHNAFVSYHVGIRQEALTAMIDLVNKHHDLPTLCLLLGNMFAAANQFGRARQCWSLAVHRDGKRGAVALAAARRLQSSSSKK